jgi:hypothetical protein
LLLLGVVEEDLILEVEEVLVDLELSQVNQYQHLPEYIQYQLVVVVLVELHTQLMDLKELLQFLIHKLPLVGVEVLPDLVQFLKMAVLVVVVHMYQITLQELETRHQHHPRKEILGELEDLEDLVMVLEVPVVAVVELEDLVQ